MGSTRMQYAIDFAGLAEKLLPSRRGLPKQATHRSYAKQYLKKNQLRQLPVQKLYAKNKTTHKIVFASLRQNTFYAFQQYNTQYFSILSSN